jgi:hypothetical protein
MHNFFFNYTSRFVSYYKERNKQMTIKHNNLINRYYIKTVVFRWSFFHLFRYTHSVLAGNPQGKIYLKYLGIEERMILKWIFKVLMGMRGLELYGSG